MEIFNGRHDGPASVTGEHELQGMVTGDLTVEDGGKLLVTGMCCANLIVQQGARVIVRGMVMKNIHNLGGYVEIYGNVKGNVLRDGGETLIHGSADIEGQIVDIDNSSNSS